MVLLEILIPYIENLSYFGVFLFLAFIGYVLPIPEELQLLTVGYIVGSTHFGNLYIVMLVSILGLATANNIVYWLSRRGHKLFQTLKKRFGNERVEKFEKLLQDHAGLTIFSTKFVAGLRHVGPVLAGTTRVPWKKFQLYNALALAVYTPIFVYLGFIFHDQLARVTSQISAASNLILVLAIIIISTVIAWHVRKYLRAKAIRLGALEKIETIERIEIIEPDKEKTKKSRRKKARI